MSKYHTTRSVLISTIVSIASAIVVVNEVAGLSMDIEDSFSFAYKEIENRDVETKLLVSEKEMGDLFRRKGDDVVSFVWNLEEPPSIAEMSGGDGFPTADQLTKGVVVPWPASVIAVASGLVSLSLVGRRRGR